MDETHTDVLIIGAGLGGLYAAYRIRELGLSFRVLEAGGDVGGTWYWNRYPGARCDVVSMEYSYSFSPELEQEWTWSERYAAQPEILRYINHVTDRFDLRRHIDFNTRVTSLDFDEATGTWTAHTEAGDHLSARYVLTAVGCLSAPKDPEVPGLDTFAGPIYRTSRWPHEGVDFTGQRVGVIGTGSSGIQSIPVIAESAEHLTVFQRTATFSLPARNRPLEAQEVAAYKRDYPHYRRLARESRGGVVVQSGTQSVFEVDEAERTRRFQDCWDAGIFNCINTTFTDLLRNPDANALVADFVRARIRDVITDPHLAADLTPGSFPFGTKRVCMDTDYYQTYNRPNVTLINLRRDPLVEITTAGVRTASGVHELDALVFATGFDAITGALLAMNIRGRGGQSLREKWRHGPATNLGIQTAGFPNLFMITGPGSPSIVSNVIVSIEQHVEWISALLEHAQDRGITLIETRQDAEDAWTAHVAEVAEGTLYPQADSYFTGANVPGKPRVFMPYLGGVNVYREKCDAIARDGYPGFVLSGQTERELEYAKG